MTDYIYNARGSAIGYIRDKFIHDMSGRAVGQIHGTHVHKISGSYVGELHKDMVVDKHMGTTATSAIPGTPEMQGTLAILVTEVRLTTATPMSSKNCWSDDS